MIVLLFLIAWLTCATFSFFLTYPGGKQELRRDWHHDHTRLYMYALLMVPLWWFSAAWNLISSPKKQNHLRRVK